jgi:hypothetical protein
MALYRLENQGWLKSQLETETAGSLAGPGGSGVREPRA